MSVKYFQSGQIVVGTQGEIFHTVLGSCVAVCFYDRRLKVGSMIHYVLPSHDLVASNLPMAKNPLNFAETAIPQMFKELKNLGSKPQDCEVYVFGGCQKSLQNDQISRVLPNVGRANVDAARNIIAKFGFKISKEKTTPDVVSLIVRFNSSTGEVMLQHRSGDAESEVQASLQNLPLPIENRLIKVLVVDDSEPIRRVIKACLGKYPQLKVVGEARDGIEAEHMRAKLNPDVMTLDIQMPNKDGVAYLRELMPTSPMPVIIVSDLNLKEVSPVMTALELGAFDYLQKPAASEIPKFAEELKEKIIAASGYSGKITKLKNRVVKKAADTNSQINYNKNIHLIAIGASTGGTEALRQVFAQLPAQTPPIVVVQHIPPVFSAAFAGSLNNNCQIQVKEAADGDVLQNSMAYIAPGGKQMHIEKKADQLRIRITDAPPVNRFKPSVDYLFLSIAKLDVVKHTSAAILTGMGDDGARGLLQMHREGASTYAQNEETCVVYGMPKVAVEMNAVDKIVELDGIANALLTSSGKKRWSPNKKTG